MDTGDTPRTNSASTNNSDLVFDGPGLQKIVTQHNEAAHYEDEALHDPVQ